VCAPTGIWTGYRVSRFKLPVAWRGNWFRRPKLSSERRGPYFCSLDFLLPLLYLPPILIVHLNSPPVPPTVLIPILIILFLLQFFLLFLFGGENSSTVVKDYTISWKVAGSRPDEVNEFFSMYLILPTALGPGVYSAANRHVYQKQKNNVSWD
jgi:hypothetical protein